METMFALPRICCVKFYLIAVLNDTDDMDTADERYLKKHSRLLGQPG